MAAVSGWAGLCRLAGADPRASAFPWGTLTVNVLGSLAMGLLVGWLARSSGETALAGESTRLLLAVGLLGGFTTFSAFSLEIVNIAERGQVGMAAFYAAVSVLAGVVALIAGLAIARTA
ncbi:MAG: CrcB family protein [Sphingomonadaceae bacterium]